MAKSSGPILLSIFAIPPAILVSLGHFLVETTLFQISVADQKTSQRVLPVSLERVFRLDDQPMPGTSIFEQQYRNDETGRTHTILRSS